MANDDAVHDVLHDLLAAARRFGATEAEASLAERESLSVEVRLGALEGVDREESRSVALRALIGKRQAGASTSDVSRAGLEALAERVVAMAKAAPEDPYCGLADPARLAASSEALETADSARPDAHALEAMARACEDAARAVPGITNSTGAGANADVSLFALAATNGFFGRTRATSFGLGVSPLAERDGRKERDWESRSARFLTDLPAPEAIGRTAGERAAARLGARKIASRKAPVIFENRTAGRIIGPLLGAISGAAVARGVSFLKDKLHQRLFPAGFTIEDDPLRPRGPASRPFDGEGVGVQARNLIEDGVLTTWLLNSAAARQLNLTSTGHATAGHGGPPGVGASNVTVAPGGPGDLAALMAEAGEGLLVTEMFSPSFNPNTGDYSVGVAGHWFSGGERAFPVSEITVAGDLTAIYARLRPGGDLDRRGALDTPSLLVDDLAIAGL